MNKDHFIGAMLTVGTLSLAMLLWTHGEGPYAMLLIPSFVGLYLAFVLHLFA